MEDKKNGLRLLSCLSIMMVGSMIFTGCGTSQSSQSKSEQSKSLPASAKPTASPTQEKNNEVSSEVKSNQQKITTQNITPQDIADFENGVGLQAAHVMNTAKTGFEELSSQLVKGEITIDQFHTKATSVINIEHNMYDLFKNQKTVEGLQPFEDQYNQLFNQVVPMVESLQSVSNNEIGTLKNKIDNFVQRKKEIDNQFAQVKTDIMKRAGSDASKSTNSDDSHFKKGPSKVASGGGLGDTFDTIKAAFGDPTNVIKEMNQGVGMYAFQNGKVLADFVQSRAYHVTYQMDNNPLTMDQAKELAKKLMPTDAKFIKNYTEGNQQFFVYKSDSLNPLFDEDWFENRDGDVQPGYLDIAYMMDGDKVIAIDSFTGDNP